MKVALLVPVFNTEKYLPDCLDSILNQTYPVAAVYCCNDGSTDGSLAVLKDYAARDARIHILTQENAGVSAARNRLLDALAATDAEVFGFVDSDDYLHPRMVETMVHALERTNADIAECAWQPVPTDSNWHQMANAQVSGNKKTIENLSIYLLRRTSTGAWINCVNKLYRASVIGGIRFRPGLAFEEDNFFARETAIRAKRKVIVGDALYAYRDNPTSATKKTNWKVYTESTLESVRLRLEVFLKAGLVPPELRQEWCADLTKDTYRMCIRKNLKKNKNTAEKKALFRLAGDSLRTMSAEYDFPPTGLNPIQGLIYWSCLRGWYTAARLLVYLT